MHEKHKSTSSLEHLAREQLLGYLADNKLNICGEKKTRSPSYTVAELHVAQPQKLYEIANGSFL